MEQNREPRNKSTNLWSINLQQRMQNIQWSKDSLFNSSARKAGELQVKQLNWTIPSYHIKNKLKVD